MGGKGYGYRVPAHSGCQDNFHPDTANATGNATVFTVCAHRCIDVCQYYLALSFWNNNWRYENIHGYT